MLKHLSARTPGRHASLAAARGYRQRIGLSAAWLNQLEPSAESRRQMDWRDLLQVPNWALQPAERLHEFALVAGALAIAPALRRCTHPATLQRAHRLIGPERFERVLQAGAPTSDEAAWQWAMPRRRASLRSLGLAVLAGSVLQPWLRACLVQRFELSAHCLPSPLRALPLVRLALSIYKEGADSTQASHSEGRTHA